MEPPASRPGRRAPHVSSQEMAQEVDTDGALGPKQRQETRIHPARAQAEAGRAGQKAPEEPGTALGLPKLVKDAKSTWEEARQDRQTHPERAS